VQSPTANLLLSLNATRTVVEDCAADAEAQIAGLTARIRAGDEEAFREFHRRYFDRLYQFLLVVARGRDEEARDALQETLLRVVRYAREFQTEEAFWGWLKAVARSAARDGGRKQSRYLSMLQRFSLHLEYGGDEQPDQLRLVLEESLGELDAVDRQIVEGKYLEGWSVKELAAEIGLTEKAVESRLLRLRRQLRETLLRKLRAP